MRFLASLTLLLSGAAAAAPPVPPAVTAHVVNGHFDPGDYHWLRGAFPGASPAEITAWQATTSYADNCAGAVPASTRAEMAAMGEQPPSAYWQSYSDDVCGEVNIARATIADYKTWPDYLHVLEAALPYYRTFTFAVGRAQAVASIESGTLHDKLLAIVVPDQMLRSALSWGQGDAGGDAPAVPGQVRTMLMALLSRSISDIDQRNTAWLKQVIATTGWPTISSVGPEAANNAWLLAQHADNDPVFQLRALRLIEPLAMRGEANRANYALLFDRVMLPLRGKQRYGTQFTCDATGRHPLPLEDAAHVDARRKAVGLGSIAAYAQQLRTMYGDRC